MKEEKKEFVWKYESVLDHGITPEEFEELTGFKWSERMDYLESVVTGEYSGCSDIIDLYNGFFPNRPKDERLCKKYAELADKAIKYVDYCF